MNRTSAEREVGVSERMPPGTAAATLSAPSARAPLDAAAALPRRPPRRRPLAPPTARASHP